MTRITNLSMAYLLAILFANPGYAQLIDCTGGCTDTVYGMGFDLNWRESLDNAAFDRSDFTGSYGYTRTPPSLTGPECGEEVNFQPHFGQIVLREQDGCVMDSVPDGVGCLVEIPSDSALGRGGYVQATFATVALPFVTVVLRQAVFAHFEGSIGERVIDPAGGGATRIHWGTQVGGALKLVRNLTEGNTCCATSTGTLCGAFGFGEYPVLTAPENLFKERYNTPDWLFAGGPGTEFAMDETYVAPGQQKGLCLTNRDVPCDTQGNDPCPGLGDVCDLRELGIRQNDTSLVSGGDADTSRCNSAPLFLRGTPNEHCWIDAQYAVNGDPTPGCALWNFGRHMRPDDNCDGIEDDTDGDGQPGPDKCPFHTELDPFLDSNGDGIGDLCQCGDANDDGAITGIDIGATALCANGVAPCDSRIAEADGNNSTTSLDIAGIVAVVNGQAQTSDLRCGRNNPF